MKTNPTYVTRPLLMLALLALMAITAVSIGASPVADSTDLRVPNDVAGEIADAKSKQQVYIVQMEDSPVVAYDGDIAGLPATRPGGGQKVNPNSGEVQQYVAYLNGRHNEALNAVGALSNKLYDYNVSFNGFAAELTAAQAAALETRSDVLTVWEDAARYPDTDNTPDFLGLTADGGLWDQLGGQEMAGEDVIIGVIDTGIWPEHASFSDQLDLSDNSGSSGKNNLAYGPPPGDWFGDCISGEQFSQDDCNNKLIGARFYRLGAAAATVIPDEYLSPRDRDGHGTHTASTAGGNANVPASIFGVNRGIVSGIAPRARIAAYKVCWNDAGCFLSDIVSAIDDAVTDGVDVINYSIGGGPSLLGPDDIAYLFAADAGVFVATSAGNSGPGADTVGGPASVPWITAVGASTQDRTFQGSVELGSGAEFFGASVTNGTDVLALVDAAEAGDELCHVGALDPGVVAGKIVLCLRGDIARVDKSLAVFEAGGAGLVLYNASDAQSQVTDNHWVPAVHINNTDGLAVKSYIDSAGTSATAMINGGEFTAIDAPWMADFSSRGPNGIAADIIKPDVTAPGVNVLAGNSPNPFLGAPGQLFQSISGTSMASPHVAGTFALLKQAYPDWTPAMAKSALMTTGSQDVKKEDGATPADPFDMGGGHITPNSAFDPGLVYDAGFFDYLGFFCDAAPEAFADPAATCAFLESIDIPTDASDLNLASIGIAELAGFQTIQRTVTSITPGTATYNVSAVAPPGISVVISPSALTLDEGESATYTTTFTTLQGAILDQWAFGSLTWTHGPHAVRSPIAIKPVALAAPDEVAGVGMDGSTSFDITFGYTGAYTAGTHGLIPADKQAHNVVDDPANDINTALSTGVGITIHEAAIPSGTKYARFSLFDDYTDGQDDLDLYIFGPDSAGFPFVGGSGTATSAEEVNLEDPAPGLYLAVVHGWQTDGPDANYTLFSWAVDGDAGNMTVTAPAAAVLGATETVTVDWAGLDAGTRYLGAVSHNDSVGVVSLTIVRVDTD